ncbi:MAG: hypothetical protein ACI9MC_003351 [Kiritimatiellia bacterium]|jgi:hypothetical protein
MWGALLKAELQRRARGGQLHRLRSMWTTALFGVLLGLYAAGVYAMEIDTNHMGQFLLNQLRDGQVMIGSVLAPGIAGLAVLDDRLAGRMQLESLSRMGPEQRWIERMTAGMWGLAGLVLACAPALACCVMLGGVEPWEVVHAMVGSLVSICLLGAVGALLCLVTDARLWAWLAALAWGWLTLIYLPSVAAAVQEPGAALSVELLSGALWPTSSLRHVASHLSPIWSAALGASSHALAGPATGSVLLLLTVARGSIALRENRWVTRLSSVIACLVTLAGCVYIALDPGRDVAWAGAQAGLAWLALDLMVWTLGIRRQRTARRSWLPQFAPWLRRELRSKVYGGVGLIGWWLGSAIGIGLLHLWWAVPSHSTRVESIDFEVTAMIVGLALTVIAAVSASQSDHIGGELLAGSSHGPSKLLIHRVIGAGLRTLPLLLVGSWWVEPYLALWALGFWLIVTVISLGAGWGIRRKGLAWGVALGGAFVFAVSASQSTLWGNGAIRALTYLAPPLSHGAHTPEASLISGVAYLIAALATLVLVRVRLRTWLARGS